jgi:hypothetical protein
VQLIDPHPCLGLHRERHLDRRQLEGEFYAEIGACEAVVEMYSYAIVQAEGKADIMSCFIRRGLLPEGCPPAIDADQKITLSLPWETIHVLSLNMFSTIYQKFQTNKPVFEAAHTLTS